MKVVISRHWKNPAISVSVDLDGIALSMGLADFLDAVAQEMGNPTLLVTQAMLRKSMGEASERVRLKAQEASKQGL